MIAAYIQSKRLENNRYNRGLAVLSLIIVLAIFSLIFVYLMQANGLVSCNYQIREHQQKISELKAKGERLEMEAAQRQSPVNLEELVTALGMIEVSQAIYLGTEKAVAKR
ncbi:MAG: hypothetical protein ABIF84_01455 [Patescibacteria group bacterium]